MWATIVWLFNVLLLSLSIAVFTLAGCCSGKKKKKPEKKAAKHKDKRKYINKDKVSRKSSKTPAVPLPNVPKDGQERTNPAPPNHQNYQSPTMPSAQTSGRTFEGYDDGEYEFPSIAVSNLNSEPQIPTSSC